MVQPPTSDVPGGVICKKTRQHLFTPPVNGLWANLANSASKNDGATDQSKRNTRTQHRLRFVVIPLMEALQKNIKKQQNLVSNGFSLLQKKSGERIRRNSMGFLLDQWYDLEVFNLQSPRLRVAFDFSTQRLGWFKIRRLVSRVSRIRRWLEIHPWFFRLGRECHSHKHRNGTGRFYHYLPTFGGFWW